MLQILQFVAILASALFAGAAIYINLVEHPARMSCSTELAATQWAPSYRRATFMQAPLALIGSACGVASWWLGANFLWLLAAICLLAVVPFTLFVIAGTNKALLSAGREPGSKETRQLLIRWGRLHAVRSALSMTATLIFVWQATSISSR